MLRNLFVGLSLVTTAQVSFANTCKLEIKSNDQMQYDKKELQVAASCKEVELVLIHTGKLNKSIMGHNWVLFETKNKNDVLKSSEKSGPSKDYVPDASKAIAVSKLIGGGESTTLKFSTKGLKAGGDYTYICTVPGHGSMMIGKFIVK